MDTIGKVLSYALGYTVGVLLVVVSIYVLIKIME